MNPHLSRRVALIMMSDAVRQLDFDRHRAFVDEVSQAESFEVLPVWVRQVILAGERQIAEAQPRRESQSGSRPTDPDAPRRRR